MEGPAGTSITQIQNPCSDFIAANGLKLVICPSFALLAEDTVLTGVSGDWACRVIGHVG